MGFFDSLDMDAILDDDDLAALRAYRKEKAERKLISGEELIKLLNKKKR